jgi:hypothetical protein
LITLYVDDAAVEEFKQQNNVMARKRKGRVLFFNILVKC